MNETDQALIGTDAIKAFVEQFSSNDKEVNRIIIEEILRALMEKNKNG
jgi:hypothetical protein